MVNEISRSFDQVNTANDLHILFSGNLAADLRRRQSGVGRGRREVPRRSAACPVASLDSAAADLSREKRRKAHLESPQHGRANVPAGRVLPHQVTLSLKFVKLICLTRCKSRLFISRCVLTRCKSRAFLYLNR